VSNTVAAIERGDFYQANLTRIFYGDMHEVMHPESLFAHLCAISPAPYSAFIKTPDDAILSSSPECFLSIDTEGRMCVRPIKGSARRGVNEREDADIALNLAASHKDHAENLMIVDLMRNDLARISEAGSVTVSEYAGLYTYSTIHHLISSITATRKAGMDMTSSLRALFPPGSMTGAPKIAAMRWCAEQEQTARGVYSGALVAWWQWKL
jgi:para-aminobenzoate synthetase component 1